MPKVMEPKPTTEASKPNKTKPNKSKTEKAATLPNALTSAPESPPEREVIYPEPEARIGKLTIDFAKEFIGWLEPIGEAQKKSWITDCHFRHDLCGPVRFAHNRTNRPIRLGQILLLQQEILRRRWRLNLESMIIGKYGTVLDGQHTLIALILAVLAYRANPDLYPEWDEEPWIEKLVATGCEETDDVVNTINTGIPRSDADVLYRTYWQDKPAKERRGLARLLAYAVRFVWSRTGAAEAFAPRRTHAETLEFVNRHQRLLEAVEHISTETGAEGKINRYLSPGYAAGLMYLMAASTTDDGPDSYREVKSPDESLINFSMWKEASNFWVQIAAGDKAVLPLREAFAALADKGGGGQGERLALLINAWLAYPKITPADLELEFVADSEGFKQLAVHPTCGGIDLGPVVD